MRLNDLQSEVSAELRSEFHAAKLRAELAEVTASLRYEMQYGDWPRGARVTIMSCACCIEDGTRKYCQRHREMTEEVE